MQVFVYRIDLWAHREYNVVNYFRNDAPFVLKEGMDDGSGYREFDEGRAGSIYTENLLVPRGLRQLRDLSGVSGKGTADCVCGLYRRNPHISGDIGRISVRTILQEMLLPEV
jgi:hypothetical protein